MLIEVLVPMCHLIAGAIKERSLWRIFQVEKSRGLGRGMAARREVNLYLEAIILVQRELDLRPKWQANPSIRDKFLPLNF